MTWEDLKDFVGSGTADDTYVQQCWNTAEAMVDNFVGATVIDVDVLDRCYLSVGSELFHAKNAPNGIYQGLGFDGAPIRIARDPMTPVYAVLGHYMVMGL